MLHPPALLRLEKDGAAFQLQTLELSHQPHISTHHFRNAHCYQTLQKARAVRCSSPLERLGEAPYSTLSETLNNFELFESKGCVLVAFS